MRGNQVLTRKAVTADASLVVSAAASLRLMGFTAREAAGSPAAAGFCLVNGPAGNQVSNGTFTGNADGWTLGAGWAYGSNKITFTPAAATLASQTIGGGGLIEGRSYSLAFTVADRTDGTVTASVGGTAGTTRSSNATFTETIIAGSSQLVSFTPSALFDGSIDTVTLTSLDGFVAPVSLAASGFAQAWYGADGIPIPLGLSIDWLSGEFDISIYTKEING